jgi:hypothetical protein
VRHDWGVLFLRPNLGELSEGDGVGLSDLISTYKEVNVSISAGMSAHGFLEDFIVQYKI